VKVKGPRNGGESSCKSLRSQECEQELWANREAGGGIGNRVKIKNIK
jgi:hypothetical protein